MFEVTVDLSEFRRAARVTLERIGSSMADSVQTAAQAGAAKAIESGRFKNRTGFLRGNIVAEFVRRDGVSAEWEILSRAYYSRYLEEGTSRRGPDPFMAPASETAESVLYSDLNAAIAQLVSIWS